MSPGLSMNRRLQRDRNSETRSSRQETAQKPVVVMETPETNFRRVGTLNEQAQTGMGWLERRQQQEQS